MRTLFLLFIILFFSEITFGQIENPKYDSSLAKVLGSDNYGMKNYIFVILKTGENKTKNKAFIDSCFTGHMANINKLAQSKKLVVAGPFGKNESDLRGIFILNVSSIAEAQDLLESDPAIKEGLLTAQLTPWYGSAALSEYLEIHDKIWKEKP